MEISSDDVVGQRNESRISLKHLNISRSAERRISFRYLTRVTNFIFKKLFACLQKCTVKSSRFILNNRLIKILLIILFIVIFILMLVLNIIFLTAAPPIPPTAKPVVVTVIIHDNNESKYLVEPYNVKEMFLEVLSSQTKVSMSLDGTTIHEDNHPMKGRGIHIVVLHQASLNILTKRVFDTYSPHEDDEMVEFLNVVTDGRIIVFAIKDEGTFQMKEKARRILRSLGSSHAEHLGWRDMWVMVTQKSGKVYGESYSQSDRSQTWGIPVSLKMNVTMVPWEESQCKWPKTEESERRWEFCNLLEGYGKICDCKNPSPITFQPAPILDNKVIGVPVAVIGSNRPHYLFRMLNTLLNAQGVNKNMITVYLSGYYDEPDQVVNLFGLRCVQFSFEGKAKSRISLHYKAAILETFTRYPHAKNIIVVEEDLDISVDFFSYFSQTIDLLDADKSLYCISAWNDLGYNHTSQDVQNLYRVETMPGLGFLIKKSLFKDELYLYWPGLGKSWDWDKWMRMPGVRKDRECVVPEVSRTYHFGKLGQNTNPVFYEEYYMTHAFNVQSAIAFPDVRNMLKDKYESVIKQLIKKGYPVDHSKSPCENDFIPDIKVEVFLVFIKMENSKDVTTWLEVAKCFGVWDLDVRGNHKGMWRLRMKKTETLVIGVPSSEYSLYKPKDITPIYLRSTRNKKRPN